MIERRREAMRERLLAALARRRALREAAALAEVSLVDRRALGARGGAAAAPRAAPRARREDEAKALAAMEAGMSRQEAAANFDLSEAAVARLAKRPRLRAGAAGAAQAAVRGAGDGALVPQGRRARSGCPSRLRSAGRGGAAKTIPAKRNKPARPPKPRRSLESPKEKGRLSAAFFALQVACGSLGVFSSGVVVVGVRSRPTCASA